MNIRKTLLLASLMLAAFPVSAAEIEVRMLDRSETEGLYAFEPSFVKAEVGDTLVFNPVSKGHNTVSLLIPDGAKPWKGANNEAVRVKLDKEGVYLYVCYMHERMGMVGVIQVGKPANLEEAKKTVTEKSAKFVMNKDRFSKALAKVQ